LAVHDTGSSPSVLHAVMGPKHYERLLHKEWKVKGCDFMDPLSTNDTVYFCVPIAEEEHLYLEDCAMKYIIIKLYDYKLDFFFKYNVYSTKCMYTITA
jgi:hypothetical protein